MRNLRIVFMGTPDFAVASLHAIFQHNYCIVGVVTAPDRHSGRGQKIQQSAVKQYAVSKNIKVLQPQRLKDDNFIADLRSLKANLQVVVAFRMLPKIVWDMPIYGTFNLHASLLPHYRGAAPINWAIIYGENTTGITTFFIDEHIDTGHIILQKEVEIDDQETAGELHDKLMIKGADLVLQTITCIAKNRVTLTKQKEKNTVKTAAKIDKNTCRIDWHKKSDDIYNFIRGLSPYPGAWTLLKNGVQEIPVKIYSTKKEKAVHSSEVGKLIHHEKTLKVVVNDGFIHLEELQLPGKKKMKSTAVLNGMRLHENAKVT